MNEQKVALVTGGSRGIGASISKKLAHDGYIVVISYANKDSLANNLVQEINTTGGQSIAIKANIADINAVRYMFDEIEHNFGRIDILINNAGIMKLSPLATTNEEQINSQIDINLKGSIYTMIEAANRLRTHGRIINFSSSVVGLKLENYGIYAATKSTIETLTGILAKELRGRSITVNTIAPGPTSTELFLEGKSDELIQKMAYMNPLERLGAPEDIANIVSFLVSSKSDWINGQVIRANGGMI